MALNSLIHVNSNQILHLTPKNEIEVFEKQNHSLVNKTTAKVNEFCQIIQQAGKELNNTPLSNPELFKAYENASKRYVHFKAKLRERNIFFRIGFKISQILFGRNLDKEFEIFESTLFKKADIRIYLYQYLKEGNVGKDSHYDLFLIKHLGKIDRRPITAETGEIAPHPIVRILFHQIQDAEPQLEKLSKEGKTPQDKEFACCYDQLMTKTCFFSSFILHYELPRCLPLWKSASEKQIDSSGTRIKKALEKDPQILENYSDKIKEKIEIHSDARLLIPEFETLLKISNSFEKLCKLNEFEKNFSNISMLYDLKPNLASDLSLYLGLQDELQKLNALPLNKQYHHLIDKQNSYISFHFSRFASQYKYCRDLFEQKGSPSKAFYQKGTQQNDWRELYNAFYKQVDEMIDAKKFKDNRDQELFTGLDEGE